MRTFYVPSVKGEAEEEEESRKGEERAYLAASPALVGAANGLIRRRQSLADARASASGGGRGAGPPCLGLSRWGLPPGLRRARR